MYITTMLRIYIIISLIFLTSCASWSRADKAFLIASWTATTADIITTRNVLQDGGYETNNMMSDYPDDKELITYLVSCQLIVTILAHFLPKYRKAILGVKTVLNTRAAIHNSRE